MSKEGLGGKPGSYKCCSACMVVMMVFWTLIGFVAGLLVGTLGIRGQLFKDLGLMGGVGSEAGVDRVTDGDNQISKPACHKTNASDTGHSGILNYCTVCGETR